MIPSFSGVNSRFDRRVAKAGPNPQPSVAGSWANWTIASGGSPSLLLAAPGLPQELSSQLKPLSHNGFWREMPYEFIQNSDLTWVSLDLLGGFMA